MSGMKHYKHRTMDPKRTIGGRYLKSTNPDYRPDSYWSELRKQLIQAARFAVANSQNPTQVLRNVCAKSNTAWAGHGNVQF